MDRNGLLNPQGLWNRRGVLLAALIAAAAFVGFRFSFVKQILAALGLFTAAWLLFLAAAFILAVVEWVGELGLARLAAHLPALRQAGRRMAASPQWLAMMQRLAQPLARWRWRKAEWAEVPNVTRIDQWRRHLVRVADSRQPHHRRAA